MSLVPELYCRDFETSFKLYTEVFGFTQRFGRDGFAYLEQGTAELMLEQVDARSWIVSGGGENFGRGVNFQITIDDLSSLIARARAAGVRIFRNEETVSYRVGETFLVQRQIVYRDPDDYLLRFCESLGTHNDALNVDRVVA